MTKFLASNQHGIHKDSVSFLLYCAYEVLWIFKIHTIYFYISVPTHPIKEHQEPEKSHSSYH